MVLFYGADIIAVKYIGQDSSNSCFSIHFVERKRYLSGEKYISYTLTKRINVNSFALRRFYIKYCIMKLMQ